MSKPAPKKRLAGLMASFVASAGLCFSGVSEAAPAPPYSTQRLETLLEKVAAADAICPGTCGLENIVSSHNIHPRLVTSHQLDLLAPGEGAQIVGRQQGNHLYLNGAYPDAKLLETFAHETRHVWQKQDLGAVAEQLDPQRALVLYRFREADAFAFAIYFTYRVEQATGQKLVKVPDDPQHYKNMHPYYRMYAVFKLNMDSGMPLPAAYRSLLKDCFDHVKRVDYDDDILSELEQKAKKGDVPQAGSGMTDAQFSRILRRMGTPSFTVGPGAFDGWSDAELRDPAKTGGISKANLARLERLAPHSAENTGPPPAKPAPGKGL